MTYQSRVELASAWRCRYRAARREEKTVILDEFCELTGYHRKYATSLLNGLEDVGSRPKRCRRVMYSAQTVRVLAEIWEAAGYPWSVRLKALLPLWLPWARVHFSELTTDVERQLVAMSPRQMDRRLQERKRTLGRRIYGRTKPGTLLKHHIAIRTDNWDIKQPGFVEIDLVSHSGSSASGEFIHSFNLTDIHTGWGETRAVMGKGENGIVCALEQMRQALPFTLRGIDSDNGSEFINYHLKRYCDENKIQFTRGRPYKKDDNAHIEQKNWTHVRKLLAWDRYDSSEALEAINALYQTELRVMMNYFQPAVKLIEKTRVGSRLKRRYDAPTTPLDRCQHYYTRRPTKLIECCQQRTQLDPFELAQGIEARLETIYGLRHR